MPSSRCAACAGLPAAHAECCSTCTDQAALRCTTMELFPDARVVSAGQVGSPLGPPVHARCSPARITHAGSPLLQRCALSHFAAAAMPAPPRNAHKGPETRRIIGSHGLPALLVQLPRPRSRDHRRPARLLALSFAAGSACASAPLTLQVTFLSLPRFVSTSESDSAHAIYSDSTHILGLKLNRRSSLKCRDANNSMSNHDGAVTILLAWQ
jgi:hypothetical protein